MNQLYMPDQKDQITKGHSEYVDYPPTIAIVSVHSAVFNPSVPYCLTFYPSPQGGLLASLFTHPLFRWIFLGYRLFDSKNVLKILTIMSVFDLGAALS